MPCDPVKLAMERDAVMSDCGKYRYLLRRAWDHAKPRLLFVMLNPSTANAEKDDPTIRSCVRLATALGYGSIEVVNLFGLISPDPKALQTAADPNGPDNDGVVHNAIRRCDVVVFACGKFPVAAHKLRTFREMVSRYRPDAYCLGTNRDGTPKHPLYIKSGTPLQSYHP